MNNFLKSYKEEIIVTFIFLFFAFGFNVYRVQSDGLFYYTFLEHIFNPFNPDFPDFWKNNMGFHQSGCAFFNLTFYLAGYTIEKLFSISQTIKGITLRQFAINLASNFYIVLSLVLVIRILKTINFRNRILSTLSILFSTSAFTVASIMPSFNHAVDIFVNTIIVYSLCHNLMEKRRNCFSVGAFLVIAILVRYFNFVWIFPIIIYLISKKDLKLLLYFILGFAALSWAPLVLFYYFNGGFFIPFIRMKKTVTLINIGIPLFPKYALKYLIHPLHGLFIWSPVTILSCIGLFNMPKNLKKLGYLLICFAAITVLIYGFFYNWYAGWSFSNRYLVGFFPILCIGLASFLSKSSRNAKILVIAFTFFSIILFLNWRLGIINGEFGTPIDMLNAWIKGKSHWSLDKNVNIKTFFNMLYRITRYKYFFSIF